MSISLQPDLCPEEDNQGEVFLFLFLYSHRNNNNNKKTSHSSWCHPPGLVNEVIIFKRLCPAAFGAIEKDGVALTLEMEMLDNKSCPMGCIMAIHKTSWQRTYCTMTSTFLEKLRLYQSVLRYLNYTQHLVLSDLAMQSLFNDNFQLLFRIYWELWCELPTQIAFKHLSLFHIW